jgi:uncharacterized membrane protein
MNLHIALASFAATGIEFLETAVIAYALAQTGYPREALTGTLLGTLLVVIPALFLWPLFELIPVHIFQLAVGTMLLWLGLSWSIKSIRRKLHGRRPGWVDNPLRAYRDHRLSDRTGFSPVNALIMTKSAAVEGFEICLIVSGLALASGALLSALAGSLVALVATVGLVFAIKGHLQHVPEVSFKLWAGVILSAIGAFWIFEGLEKWM